jgi:hypothetical protein
LLVDGVRHRGANLLDGHVWVSVDGRPFGDSEERIAQYALTTVFDADGMRLSGSTGDSPDGSRLA